MKQALKEKFNPTLFVATNITLVGVDLKEDLSFKALTISTNNQKRLFDVVISLIFLVCVFPIIYLVFGFIIKLTSKGPILFKQLRNGLNGKTFYCYKFRTMVVNNEADRKQASYRDARITKIGFILRKTSFDELPQFINVLLGHMSVVGPRPHMIKHNLEYGLKIKDYNVRHSVKPGITGLAQISGFRGETTDISLMEKRVNADLTYILKWSTSYDYLIIYKTIINVITGDPQAF